MTKLLLVRHAQTDWNAQKRLQGHADRSLSLEGRVQAIELGRTIANTSIDAVICSDLSRARETAALAGHGGAIPCPQWREMDVGYWSGEKIADLELSAPEAYSAWRSGKAAPPGGETWTIFDSRVRDALASIRNRGGKVLVVTHSGVIRAALRIIGDKAQSSTRSFANASVTVVDLQSTW